MGGMLPGPDSSILSATGWKGSNELREEAFGLILSGKDHFGVVESILARMLNLKPTRPLCMMTMCDIFFMRFTLSLEVI